MNKTVSEYLLDLRTFFRYLLARDDDKILSDPEAFANQGPTLKRFRARARGSASSILKRTSHLTVILDQQAK